jgi:signal transduction histidine kinase
MRVVRRLSLSTWLGLLTVGVVLLVAGALAPAALRLFGRLADENARARVRLAAFGAADAVEDRVRAMESAAALLSDRPTLARLLASGDATELHRYLDRYRAGGDLDGIAVWRGDHLAAASPEQLPWRRIPVDAATGMALSLPEEDSPLAVGVAEVAAAPTARAVVVERLDETAASLSQQMGLAVSILREGSGRSTRAAVDGTYRGAATVAGGLMVEATLARAEVELTLVPLRRVFVLVTTLACLLAVLAGGLAGRRLAHPLADLQSAAARIGAGDLATPVPSAPGAELAALTSGMEDMRRRLRTLTDELRHREAEAQALLSGIVEGVFAVDGERRIQYLNDQAATLLGVSAADAVGRFCGDVLRAVGPHGTRPCDERCPIVHARSRGSSRAVEHLELAGGRRTVVVTSAPPSGTRQVQVLRDETETEAARRSRDAVLANVSHELKTPLSAQLASIELLQDGLGGLEPEAARALLVSLERSTLRLVRLVDNLLESVRIETGQTTLRRLPVNPEAVVAEAIALTRALFDQRSQQLAVQGGLGDLPALAGDASQLTQVVVNLLANAQKFAPDGSTVCIGGSQGEGSISLWVEDAGPGIPPALSTSIFDRFHRGGGEGQGMGLGLWIAKSIVERHGGQIEVSSGSRGGARFTLTLPLSEVVA